MSYLYEAVTGNYRIFGNPFDMDCIIGLSFGTSETPTSPNGQLARYAVDAAMYDTPLILEKGIVNALPPFSPKPAMVYDGAVSDTLNTQGGSWGVLKQAKEYMDEEGLANPMLVAQAFHVPRVIREAFNLGMNPIVPPGLPRDFDTKAPKQWWTRSQQQWALREPIGAAYLALYKRRLTFSAPK